MHTAIDLFPPDWLRDAAELSEARREQFRKNSVLYVTERRYKRDAAVTGDLIAYNLATLGGIGVMCPDGFYRIVIPGGAKPEVLERHLARVASDLEFFPVFPDLDDDAP